MCYVGCQCSVCITCMVCSMYAASVLCVLCWLCVLCELCVLSVSCVLRCVGMLCVCVLWMLCGHSGHRNGFDDCVCVVRFAFCVLNVLYKCHV